VQDRYLCTASEVLAQMEEALERLKEENIDSCSESEDSGNENSDEEAEDGSEHSVDDKGEQGRFLTEEVVRGDSAAGDKTGICYNEDSFTEDDKASASHRAVDVDSESAGAFDFNGNSSKGPNNSNSILYIKDAEKWILCSTARAPAQEDIRSTDAVMSTQSKGYFDRESQRKIDMRVAIGGCVG